MTMDEARKRSQQRVGHDILWDSTLSCLVGGDGFEPPTPAL